MKKEYMEKITASLKGYNVGENLREVLSRANNAAVNDSIVIANSVHLNR